MNNNEKKKNIKREITTFQMEKGLTSYEIDCGLAKRIENYLFENVSGIAGVDIDDVKKGYSVEITDDLGIEELEGIDGYSSPLFPNYTKRILFELSRYEIKNLSVRICFDISKISSKISVSYTGENAKEIVIAIYQGIIRVIDSNKTRNKFYHLGAIETIIFTTISLVFAFAIVSFLKLLYTWGIMLSCIFVIYILYLTIGRKIHPYTVFDSARSRNYKKWSDWFLAGILGFIIFDVVLAIILKKLYMK